MANWAERKKRLMENVEKLKKLEPVLDGMAPGTGQALREVLEELSSVAAPASATAKKK